jgi:hypothetical protein
MAFEELLGNYGRFGFGRVYGGRHGLISPEMLWVVVQRYKKSGQADMALRSLARC